jgi:lipopolysaccharide export LptBFGC system permease protein LptF
LVIERKNSSQTQRKLLPLPSHTTIFFYLLKECLPPIILSLLVLTTLVFSQQIARNLEFLLSPFGSWQISAQILLNLLPGVLIFTLPIALLIGTTIGLHKLSAENEWIALESLSIKLLPRLLPFLLLGVTGTACLLYLTWEAAPRAIMKLRGLRNLITIENAALQIKPRTFITNFPNHLLQIASLDRTSGMWKGVLLIKQDNQTNNLQILAAQRGFISEKPTNDDVAGNVEIKLQDGVSINKLLTPQEHESGSFQEYVYKIPLDQTRKSANHSPAPGDVTATSTGSLLKQARQRLPANEARPLQIELQRRFVLSFASLYAVIVALALNVKARPRTARNVGKLILGFLFCVLFFTLLSAGQSLALANKVPIYVGMWGGAVISLFALWVFAKCRDFLAGFLLSPFTRLRRRPKSGLSATQKDAASETLTQQQLYTPAKGRMAAVVSLVNYLLLSEVVKFFLVALGILVATVLLFTLLDISPSLSKNNIHSGYAIGYLALLSPQMAYYFAPFALLLALIIAAAALARTGQLAVLLYYSNNLPQLLFPLFIFGVTVLGLMYVTAEAVLPVTNREQDERFRRIKGRSNDDISTTIRFDRKWVLDETGNVAGFKVNNLNNNSAQFDVIQLRLKDEKYYLQEVLACPMATVNAAKSLQGIPTFTYHTDEFGLARPNAAPNQPVALNLTTEVIFRTPAFEASKMSLKQLKEYIRDVERVGLPIVSLKMDKAQRMTFPFTCLSLACLALPLAFVQVRRKHQGGFRIAGIGIVLALCFWATLSLFETAGKNGLVPIDLAAWAPHGLFISLAAVLYAKLNAT